MVDTCLIPSTIRKVPWTLCLVVLVLTLGAIMVCFESSSNSVTWRRPTLIETATGLIGILVAIALLSNQIKSKVYFFIPAVRAQSPPRQRYRQDLFRMNDTHQFQANQTNPSSPSTETIGGNSNYHSNTTSSSSSSPPPQPNASLTLPNVPFIVVREPKWTDLNRAIDRYDADATKLLQTLSRALEVALLSEEDLNIKVSAASTSSFPFDTRKESSGNRQPLLLLSERLQKRIETLAILLEQDGKLLRDRLLQPFPVVHALPSPCDDVYQTGHYDRNTTTQSTTMNGTTDAEQHLRPGPCRAHTHINKNKNDNDALMESSYNSAYQVLAHIVRDWSILGKPLRDSLYGWCITQMHLYHPIQPTSIPSVAGKKGNRSLLRSVLVPGAGLGRLAWELARLGYAVEANEASLVMAATAHALLNNPHYLRQHEALLPGQDAEGDDTISEGQDVIHPFLLDALTNEVNSQRRYDAVSFPDQQTNIVLPKPNTCSATTTTITTETCISIDSNRNHLYGTLSYTIGDFVHDHVPALTCPSNSLDRDDDGVGGDDGAGGMYGAVVTCFFVDTATNIYEYVALIHQLLVPTVGLWINVGPLQWHRNSVLPVSADELKDILQLLGFEILHWSVDVTPLEYRQHEQTSGGEGDSDTRWTNFDAYRPLRFVARRRR